VAEDVSRVSRR